MTDEFVKEQKRRELLIANQNVQILSQRHEMDKLRLLISIGIIIVVVISALITYSYFKKRQRRLVKVNNQILEVKNKELTRSSLRIIESDEQLEDFKLMLEKSLLEDDPKPTVKKIIGRLKVNTKKDWEEFDLRLKLINKEFFERLQKKYPTLSHNELRVCAMVNSTLSGKDMARLMGISLKSVHTARYRMRKKLGLSNDLSLEQFIAEV